MEQLPVETKERVWRLQRGRGGNELERIFGINTETVGVGGDGLHVGLFLEVAVSTLQVTWVSNGTREKGMLMDAED